MFPIRRRIQHAIARRQFVTVGAAGTIGLGLADLLQAEAEQDRADSPAKSIIFVWLAGGPATLDMWDPKPQASEEIRGEFESIATAVPGVHFGELMSQTAKIADRCTLVRSLHHNIPDHVPGSQYVMTGNPPNPALEYPSIGSLSASLLPASAGMPAYFCLGDAASSGGGFLGAAHDPFRVAIPSQPAPLSLDGLSRPESLTEARLHHRRQLRDVFEASFVDSRRQIDVVPTLTEFQQQAFEILSSNRIGQAFDLSTETDAVRERYGRSEAGRSTLTARRLIEAGARFVTVGIGGWDTHSDHFPIMRRQLPPLDQALHALIQDLAERGMLEETLVVCGGEFGRTPKINAGAGRDHWSRAMTYLLAGGGLSPGAVLGETDPRGFAPIRDACSPDDLSATILSQLGFSPSHQVQTTAGRPIEMFINGTVLTQIVG
ncbi:DUF1501 domain-containing protein [Roseiconus nitratireducens]|uniref:DUF1501 domain-containing protein n=1 Tax=Roseiconus nitratireducens TaxID=2605748 RepID=A0A5M6CWI4_9BACT|nr:DUF1501 domain-containing protein [Roseiconus nitratireducens]KAA5539453.1 DUF1501 domain-containing protein [Roseiconus nitratireducens]